MKKKQVSVITLSFLSFRNQEKASTPIRARVKRDPGKQETPMTNIPCQLPLGQESCQTKPNLQFTNQSCLRQLILRKVES